MRSVAKYGWLCAAALAAVLVIRHVTTPSRGSIASLVAVQGTRARAVEPRLCGGFAWAPMAQRRGAARRDPVLALAIADTLVVSTKERSPAAVHAAGVAQLLAGKPREAWAALSTASSSAASDPCVFSDLAAALYENAAASDAPELLAEALTSADAALAIAPSLPEALFNRALILERLGLTENARAAWQRFVAADQGRWAAEGRAHVERLRPAASFLATVDRDLPRLARDATAVHALARANPQEARARTEMELLGRWGELARRGDPKAGDFLAVARELGAELARIHGDRMVAEAVAAIDRAPAPARAVLADAHAQYLAGLRAFQNSQPLAAEPLLRGAAEGFARANSPMRIAARFFAANTVFEQGRQEEARQQLEQLRAEAPARLIAFRAQLLWQLGVCATVRGEWGPAISLLEESDTLFAKLGEAHNRAGVHRVIALIYDRAGDPATAWRHRMIALGGAGGQPGLALEKVIATVAAAALLRHEWRTAISFLNAEIEIATQAADEVQHADALLLRAAARDRIGDAAGARSDLLASEAANGRAKDAAYQTYGRSAQAFVRAMLAESPADAEALLTDAIAFESSRGDRVNLPGLFLQRGRARRSIADPRGAAADFESGMAELELHRQSLPAGLARWGVFFSAAELFDEAVDLALQQHDAARAFAIAERGRARTLLDTYGVPRAPLAADLDDETAIVEYVALPSRLVVFVVRRRGIEALSIARNRLELASEIDARVTLFRSGSVVEARRAAASLYQRLVQPVAPLLAGARTIVFVPDATTDPVPFNGLLDGNGAFLVEQASIVVAPSAAVFHAAARRRRPAGPQSVLVVANAEGEAGDDSLPAAGLEATRVARLYSRAAVLRDRDASFAHFAARAATAGVIHFAGHGIGDERGVAPASILFRADGGAQRVSAAEIASLRLPNAPVVVLAGCNTARGERRGTEGVLSVANGFLLAGAPSVVATLWPIPDDATSQFVPLLHQQLARGASPAAALRAVQMDAIRRGHVSPAVWSAFQNIGS